jgi:uncharacterized membrane protein
MDSNQNTEETRVTEDTLEESTKRPIQRWPAILALLVIAVAYSEVSEGLAFVPRVVIPAAVLIGVLLIWLALLRGRHLVVRPIALGLLGVITIAEVASTLLLVSILLTSTVAPSSLLTDAVFIWLINVVTFALWYWEIDGGGPLMRRDHLDRPKDFLFPQQAQGELNWLPGFLDYLFLAFNHSTAFSPTDTAVLSPRAKVMVMIQATLALMAVVVLIAKAINSL